MTDQQKRTLRQIAAHGGRCSTAQVLCHSSLRKLLTIGMVAKDSAGIVALADAAWPAMLTTAMREVLRYSVERGRVSVAWAGGAMCQGVVAPPAARQLCSMGLTESVGRGRQTRLELTERGEKVARAVVDKMAMIKKEGEQ